MTFSFPGLSEGLCRAAQELGYTSLFSIQSEDIPVILKGKSYLPGFSIKDTFHSLN